MAARFGIGIALAMAIPCASFAQSGPPVLSMPPVGMVPARGGGTLPPGYGVRPPAAAQPVQSAPVVQLAQPTPPPTMAAVSNMQTLTPGTQALPPFQGAAQPAQQPVTPPQQAQAVGVQPQQGQQAGVQGQPGAPAVPVQTHEQKMDEHFMAALEGMMPVNPEQLARTKIEANRRAKEAVRPSTMPSPVTRSINLSLRPGEALPTIKTFVGNATTLTFADRTGAAWPVLSVTAGNPTAFKIDQIGPQGTSNMIIISPLQQFAYANNIVVTLVNNPVPIIFSLETGGSTVDFRVDIGLRTRGPNAVVEPAGFAALAPTNDANMQGFVDGVPPQGARRLSSSRSDVEAWQINDMMYIRTNLDLFTPPPTGGASHVSGFKVYSLMFSPVIILSQNGKTVKAYIEDRGGRR